MMDGIFGIGDVGRIYVAPAGSVDFKPLGETKPMTLIASENGDDLSAWKETTATIELKVKHKRTKRGKIMRDKALERLLTPKRYRLPRKMKKRLKRENNGNLQPQAGMPTSFRCGMKAHIYVFFPSYLLLVFNIFYNCIF